MSACVYALFAGVGYEEEHKGLFGNTEQQFKFNPWGNPGNMGKDGPALHGQVEGEVCFL